MEASSSSSSSSSSSVADSTSASSSSSSAASSVVDSIPTNTTISSSSSVVDSTSSTSTSTSSQPPSSSSESSSSAASVCSSSSSPSSSSSSSSSSFSSSSSSCSVPVPNSPSSSPPTSESASPQPQGIKLIAKFLPLSYTEADLQKLFSPYGVILASKIAKDFSAQPNRSLGFGFVELESSERAQKAVQGLNGMDLGGKQTLVVEFAVSGKKNDNKKSAENDDAQVNIYAAGLPASLKSEQLEKLFSPFGTVVSSHILVDRSTNQSRGVGFVKMDTHESAKKAINALNGQKPDNFSVSLTVRFARPEGEKSNTSSSSSSYGPSKRSSTMGNARSAVQPYPTAYHPFPTMTQPSTPAYPQYPALDAYMTAVQQSYSFSFPTQSTSSTFAFPTQSASPTSLPTATTTMPQTAFDPLASSVTDPYMQAYYQQYYASLQQPQIQQPQIQQPQIQQLQLQQQPTTSVPSAGVTLFIFHLPSNTTEEELRKLFADYGSVMTAKVVTDKDTGANKGYGFVTMSTLQEAQAAITALNGYAVGNKHLRVSFKTERNKM